MTLEQLHAMNASHESEHGKLTEQHLAKMEAVQRIIEDRTKHGTPAPGDIVILHGYSNYDKKEVTHNGGHLEQSHGWYDAPHLSCCVHPTTPHVSKDGTMSASGGYWLSINPDDLKHVGTREKIFWTWRAHPCGNGGVRFPATVNVWEYTDRERIY